MPIFFLDLEKKGSGEFNPYQARSSPHILLHTLDSESLKLILKVKPPESGTSTKYNHLLLGPESIFH